MSIENSIKNAINTGKSNGISRLINTGNKKSNVAEGEIIDNDPIQDKINRLQRRKEIIDEITQIENSIVDMHETLEKQKRVADSMLAMALGGIIQDINNDEHESMGSFDMESMNLASLSQSRLYQNQRDFHERVLMFKNEMDKLAQIGNSSNTTDDGELDLKAIQQNIDNLISDAVNQLTSTSVVDADYSEVEDDEENN